VTLPEVVTGDLAGKFGEILLYNQHTDFKFGSASNSNSTSPWAIVCEPATQPSCANSPLHECYPYGLCNTSKAHAKALSARRAGKEIISEYMSDSNTARLQLGLQHRLQLLLGLLQVRLRIGP
jgi:hypothetical protein